MLNQGRIGVGDKARDIVKGYIGVDGKARKIKKIYVGDINGKARLAWTRQLQAPRIVAGPLQTEGLEYELVKWSDGRSSYIICGRGTSTDTDLVIRGDHMISGLRADTIGPSAFKGDALLKNVLFSGDGDKMVWFNDSCFASCRKLERLCILEGGYAGFQSNEFKDCVLLQSLSLPVDACFFNLTSFEGCPLISNVYYAGTAEQWSQRVRGGSEFLAAFPYVTIHYESVDPYFDKYLNEPAKIYDHPGNLATAFDIYVDGEVVRTESAGRNRRVCKVEWPPTEGIQYTLTTVGSPSGDFKAYFVESIGTATSTDIVIPSQHKGEKVAVIGSAAFKGNTNLKSVTIQMSLLEGAPFPTPMEDSFDNCASLERVRFTGEATFYENRFSGCTSLHSLSLPVVFWVFEDYPFSDSPITDIYYEGTRAQWDEQYGHDLLAASYPNATIHYESVDPYFTEQIYNDPVERLPDPPITIESVDPLTPGGEALYGKNWFTPQKGDVNTFAKLYSDPEELRIPKKAVFYGDSVERYVVEIDKSSCQLKNNLRSVYLPDTIVNIYDYAFQQCPALEKVHLSQSLKTIGDYVFRECTSLERIVLPDSLGSLGANAFLDCTSLRSVTLGPKVVIGNNAFKGCTSLKYVFFTGTPEEWDALQIGTGNEALTGAAVYFVNYFEVEAGQLPAGNYQMTAVAKAEGYENSPPSEAITYNR